VVTQLCAACGCPTPAAARYCPNCGMVSAAAPPMVPSGAGRNAAPMTLLPAGTLLDNRYEVVRPLARGGMSVVYEGWDHRLSNRRCAIKVLNDAGLGPVEQQEARAWFAREGQVLSCLRHPAILDPRDYFADRGRHCLVLEYVDGATLESVLASRGSPGLPPREVLAWGEALCDVLTYLHSQRPPLIFRDVKPDNIMVEGSGALKLIDFGIARSLDQGAVPAPVYTSIGTPGYSPPEQYQGLLEPRSDVYALGATLHHLLSGRDPRQCQPFTYPPLGSLVPGLHPTVEVVVARAVTFRLEDRFDTMDDLRRALGLARAGRALPPRLRGAAPAGQRHKPLTHLVFRGQRYPVTTWKDVLLTVALAVRQDHLRDFDKCLALRGRTRSYFSRDPGALSRAIRISGTDIYVETNLGASGVRSLCYRIMDTFGYPHSDLRVHTR